MSSAASTNFRYLIAYIAPGTATDPSLPATELSPHEALKPANTEPSLWALAYQDLRQINPDLVEQFHCVSGIGLLDDGVDTEMLARQALQAIDQVTRQRCHSTSSLVRRYYEQGVKVALASREFINPLIATNPYAAAAWTGMSLLLPVGC